MHRKLLTNVYVIYEHVSEGRVLPAADRTRPHRQPYIALDV